VPHIVSCDLATPLVTTRLVCYPIVPRHKLLLLTCCV
jgi:hypothetical protein